MEDYEVLRRTGGWTLKMVTRGQRYLLYAEKNDIEFFQFLASAFSIL